MIGKRTRLRLKEVIGICLEVRTCVLRTLLLGGLAWKDGLGSFGCDLGNNLEEAWRGIYHAQLDPTNDVDSYALEALKSPSSKLHGLAARLAVCMQIRVLLY